MLMEIDISGNSKMTNFMEPVSGTVQLSKLRDRVNGIKVREPNGLLHPSHTM